MRAAGGGAALHGLRIQLRVVGALTLRELGTRFGRDNLGYVWLFFEPALLGGALGVLHHVSGHAMPGGVDPASFWVIGYIPYYLLRGVLNRGPSAIAANQSLLYHRHVTLLDIMLARDLLEAAATGGALVGFLLFFGLVAGDWPREPAQIVLGMLLMFGFAHGAAMLLAAGSVYTELFDRVTHLFTYLSLPITGAFFMVFWLPTELQRRRSGCRRCTCSSWCGTGSTARWCRRTTTCPTCSAGSPRSTCSAWRRCGGRAATSRLGRPPAMIALRGVRKSYHTRHGTGRC
jgi:capsular polysaccharide transport system permease protein